MEGKRMTVLEQRACESLIKMAHRDDPDYWEKLKHQYAGMAMQGMLNNQVLLTIIAKKSEKYAVTLPQAVANDAYNYATALVEKLKAE